MADAEDKKRRCEIALTVEDVLYLAHLFMNNDPFKQHAPREEDANFQALPGQEHFHTHKYNLNLDFGTKLQ
jgi:hypothetical protein